MKYILIFLFALLCSVGYAQFPVNQYMGSQTTLVTSRGGLKADSSLILPQFPDTTTANRSPYIKFYPGNLIRVFNDIYMRNTTATGWILISGGGGSNNFIDSLKIISDSVYARKYGVFVYQYKTPTTDTTSLSNRINQKIDSLYKIGDSVFARKNGVFVFQYLDISQNILANNGLSFSGDTLQLGGSLTKNTTIDLNSNNSLDFTNANNFNVKDTGNRVLYEVTPFSNTMSFGTPIQKQGLVEISPSPSSNGNVVNISSRYNTNDYSYIVVSPEKINIVPNSGELIIEQLDNNTDTTGFKSLIVNPLSGKVEYNNLPTSTDTTSLSNRINQKIDSLYKSGDSVYARKNGVFVFQYIDPSIDTTSLSNRINLKLNISDTAAMLSPYYRAADTVNLRRVTSVGLTMPSAFTVANSPITTSGTIGVTGAGTSGQYVRGDGSLGIFPTIGGGGGGSVYYLNGNTSQGSIGGTTMYQLSKAAGTGAAANFTRATTGTIASFITDAGDPNQLTVPAGIWIFECYLSESGGGANHATVQAIVEKWNGTTITVIGTGTTEEITNGNVKELYQFGVTIPNGTTISLTDRIVIQIQIANANGKTVTLYTENGNLSSVTTTFANGISSINSLTAAAQTLGVATSGTDFNISSSGSAHTFNLPTASATNRGALSIADWSTFNGKLNPSDTTSISNRINLKQNLITLTTTGTSGAATFNQSTGALNIPQYLAGTNIYNTDGTLIGNRTVTMGSNTLSFTGDLTVNGLTVGKGRSSIVSNTALGVSALVGNSGAITGTHNVMLGNEAGFNVTSANDNVAVGSQAFRANTGGIRNVAIGRGAMQSGTGGGNVGIGYNALNSGTSGDHNVGVGNQALSATSGSQNVGIGYFAGVYNTTASSQIFLNSLNRTNYSGDQTGSPFYAQQNTTVANQIVTLNGRIGINTTSPSTSAGLEVSSTTQGFLQPRMTTAQMNAISTPATGLTIFNTTDSSVYVRRGTGAGWQQIANEIFATATLDFPNTLTQTSSDLTITLTGAIDGDAVVLGVPNAAVNANSNYFAWVSAANTVTVRFNNYSSGAINPASATFRVTIIK